eukprot:2656956-Pyramimonas_sp.AAC.1
MTCAKSSDDDRHGECESRRSPPWCPPTHADHSFPSSICSSERIYNDLVLATLGGHLMTGAMVTAGVFRRHRRPRALR